MKNSFDSIIPKPKKIAFKQGRGFRIEARIPCVTPEDAFLSALFRTHKTIIRPVVAGEKPLLTARIDRAALSGMSVRRELLDDGYVLDINRDSIELRARTGQGLFYGFQTLFQVFRLHGSFVPQVRIEDWPDMLYRGAHCMMGCGTLNFKMMKKCVERMAHYKMTHLVLEYDNRFPWEKHPLIAHSSSYTKDEIRELIKLGLDNHIEITPCLDSLGHAQPYLWPKAYAHLRENPGKINDLCVTDPRARKFMKELWTEVLDMHPESEYAHITGDEVWYAAGGLCRSKGKGSEPDLYRKWYKDLSDWIVTHGKTPMLWGDMLVKHPSILRGFSRDVVVCDWCYEAPDLPYSTEGAYFRKLSRNGKIDSFQEKVFGKYWSYNGSKSKFRNFPYPRFFQDNGFRVVGCTASSNPGMTNIVPWFETRFVNNKQFAAELKACGALGMLVTWWSDDIPMETAWSGILSGADQGWHSRDESLSVFTERFGRNFMEMRGTEPGSLLVMDSIYYRRDKKHSGYLNDMWVSDKRANMVLRKLRAAAMRGRMHAEYKRLIEVNAELVKLQSDLGTLYNRVNRLRTGFGRDVPVDIGKFTNRKFSDSLPPNTMYKWKLGPADTHISGVRINTISSTARNGGETIVLKGARNKNAPRSVSGIPVNLKADKLFFFYSGYDVGTSDQHIADIIVSFADGETDRLPVKAGENIIDWNYRGGFSKPLPGAVIAWTGYARYFYMGWWKNRRPDVEVTSVDLVSAGNPGYLILGGITARINEKPASGYAAEASELLKELKKQKQNIEKWNKKLNSVLKTVMTKQELDAKKEGGVIYKRLVAWRDFYEKELELFLGKASGL